MRREQTKLTVSPFLAQTNPLLTKSLTSTGGFIVGDTLAQVAVGGSESYDWWVDCMPVL